MQVQRLIEESCMNRVFFHFCFFHGRNGIWAKKGMEGEIKKN